MRLKPRQQREFCTVDISQKNISNGIDFRLHFAQWREIEYKNSRASTIFSTNEVLA